MISWQLSSDTVQIISCMSGTMVKQWQNTNTIAILKRICICLLSFAPKREKRSCIKIYIYFTSISRFV